MRRRRVVILCVGSAILGSALAGSIAHAVEGSDSVYYACDKDGSLIPGTLSHNVAPQCSGGSVLISWNSTGPAGPPGPGGGGSINRVTATAEPTTVQLFRAPGSTEQQVLLQAEITVTGTGPQMLRVTAHGGLNDAASQARCADNGAAPNQWIEGRTSDGAQVAYTFADGFSSNAVGTQVVEAGTYTFQLVYPTAECADATLPNGLTSPLGLSVEQL